MVGSTAATRVIMVTAGLVERAARYGLTLGTLIQGVWALLLGDLLDTDRVVFGTGISGRPAELAGYDAIVGLLGDSLPPSSPGRRTSQWVEVRRRLRPGPGRAVEPAARAARPSPGHPEGQWVSRGRYAWSAPSRVP
ncbi:hypothetical protein [Streptomyces sp. NBC_00069]|uniref:hypothetical protein n=1 Tax=Streptomyces sp. NBC_00069 TaxID=2975639 RepID=UPI00324D809D